MQKSLKELSSSPLINLYNTFMLPYMIYCVEMYGNGLSTHIHPLIRLQKTKNFELYNNYLYSTSGILPFNIFVKYRIRLLMNKLSKSKYL